MSRKVHSIMLYCVFIALLLLSFTHTLNLKKSIILGNIIPKISSRLLIPLLLFSSGSDWEIHMGASELIFCSITVIMKNKSWWRGVYRSLYTLVSSIIFDLISTNVSPLLIEWRILYFLSITFFTTNHCSFILTGFRI